MAASISYIPEPYERVSSKTLVFSYGRDNDTRVCRLVCCCRCRDLRPTSLIHEVDGEYELCSLWFCRGMYAHSFCLCFLLLFVSVLSLIMRHCFKRRMSKRREISVEVLQYNFLLVPNFRSMCWRIFGQSPINHRQILWIWKNLRSQFVWFNLLKTERRVMVLTCKPQLVLCCVRQCLRVLVVFRFNYLLHQVNSNLRSSNNNSNNHLSDNCQRLQLPEANHDNLCSNNRNKAWEVSNNKACGASPLQLQVEVAEL